MDEEFEKLREINFARNPFRGVDMSFLYMVDFVLKGTLDACFVLVFGSQIKKIYMQSVGEWLEEGEGD